MTATPRPTCRVCHQPLGDCDQYLVRIDGRGTSFVHRSLCFPPARTGVGQAKVQPEARAA
jgi:hypothetical protein